MRRGLAVALLALVAVLAAAAWYDRPPVAPGAWLGGTGLAPRYEIVAGHRVRFVRAGSGSAVVLIHGFGSSPYLHLEGRDPGALGTPPRGRPRLAGFRGVGSPGRPVARGLPGGGARSLDRLGIERAALVGNSMGGATAAILAGTAPGRVSRLVLLDAAGFNLEPGAQPATVRVLTSWAAPVLGLLPGKRLVVEMSLRQVFHEDALVREERVSEYLAPAQRPGTFAPMRSLGASLDAEERQIEAYRHSLYEAETRLEEIRARLGFHCLVHGLYYNS